MFSNTSALGSTRQKKEPRYIGY